LTNFSGLTVSDEHFFLLAHRPTFLLNKVHLHITSHIYKHLLSDVLGLKPIERTFSFRFDRLFCFDSFFLNVKRFSPLPKTEKIEFAAYLYFSTLNLSSSAIRLLPYFLF
jgi:hypothetical protein